VNADQHLSAPPSGKHEGGADGRGRGGAPRDAERGNELRILRRHLSEIQVHLAAVRGGARELAEIEGQRRLTPDEHRRARSLRWESERLRYELQLLRDRFEALTAGRQE
jgi:hypothetical protein